MSARPPSTGFAALDGLLKRAREQKKANPAPSKRMAVANGSEASKGNGGNVPRPSSVAVSQLANVDKGIDSLDDGDALLDYVPDDIEDILNGVPLEEDKEQEGISLQPQNAAQSQVSQQVSQQVSAASSRLAQFEYRTPVRPPAQKERQIDIARSISFLQQQQSAKKSAASSTSASASISRSASTSVFKTIERTIVNRRKQKSTANMSGRQELPGPAGLINSTTEDIGETIAPTQRPVSVFRTPFARRPGAESASEADFESGTWSAMLDFLQLPSYTPKTAKRIMRDHKDSVGVSIQWVQKNVKQTQKVCRMLVQIQDIVGGDHDVNAVVVDPTGEMSASIHRQVVVDLARECTAGTSVILENVVVLVLAGARPSLVVTSASIVRVFAVETSGSRFNPIVLTQTQTQTQAQAQMQPDDLNRRYSQGTPTQPPHDSRLVQEDGVGCEIELLPRSPRVTNQVNDNDNSDRNSVLNDDLGDVFMEGLDDVEGLIDILDPSP
ncbi:hypothetical protein LPJ64_003636 [Coemansia asiatica]|uniref:Homologous recombination OB-fold protein OB-fold domain-containing protein n=1 Tax=Coemansia asiatica TaxID=1052880 RepID=A0A9W7XJE6_9FUNG|nr:hypothetical protein LPJ64_003636 [Coemansia asiatica]